MERVGIARERDGEGDYRFLCTGDTDSFRDLGTRFLQMPLGEVERVEIEPR
jgi:glutamate racemase